MIALLLACAGPAGPGPERPESLPPESAPVDSEAPPCAPVPWFPDPDGDGWGDDAGEVAACEAPGEGWVLRGGDCAEGDAAWHPDADGLCPLSRTCAEALAAGRAPTSGAVLLDPDGVDQGEAPVWLGCEQALDGGGWTLVLHLSDAEGLREDDFLALFGHNRFTDATWSYDRARQRIVAGLPAGLLSLQSQGALDIARLDGLWTDLRLTCSTRSNDPTVAARARVDGYATLNGNHRLLGAAPNGTAYDIPPEHSSAGQARIWHDNEVTTSNSNHYVCDQLNADATGPAPQLGFCYTDHLNNPNALDQGDSVVALSFGHGLGGDSWSPGFTGECGAMGAAALQNSGTFSVWVR